MIHNSIFFVILYTIFLDFEVAFIFMFIGFYFNFKPSVIILLFHFGHSLY